MNELDLFTAALAIADPAERAAYLDRECAGRPDLRRRLDELLSAHGRPDGPLDRLAASPDYFAPTGARAGADPAGGETAPALPETASYHGRDEAVGAVLAGRYKLLQKVGEGGMGVVFMAEQQEPICRRVALKIIKPGMDSAQVVARFEAERQALALMDHQNIANVFDAGTTDAGRPFFVMEMVHGVPITRYCDDCRLTPRERLALFAPVCQAIQHAHTRGVIHRDVKPSNVLVTLNADKPIPKVIDFGVAKATEQPLTEKTMFTQFGQVVGTLEYMSPEQAETSTLGVDTRTDVYSLGVLLYELLTGTTPLEGKRLREAGFTESLRLIKEVEPQRPSARLSGSGEALAATAARRKTEPAKLAKLVRGELDWIVMKALEKDRNRRYETASGLAKDVELYLADEPVEACPPSAGYRLHKFARKHGKALVFAGALVLLLLLGAVASTWQAVRATQAEQAAKAERDRAQLALVGQVAERLEGEVQQMAILGNTLAAAVAVRDDWTSPQLVDLVSKLLDEDDRVHSLTLAFQPGQCDQPQGCCLFVSRGPKGKPKAAWDAFPNYHEKDWYQRTLRSPWPLWIGPGLDAGDVWTISYCVRIRRGDENVGVLTVDLQAEDFKRIWGWLEKVNLGQKSYGFVVCGDGATDGEGKDRTGAFIGHPDGRPEYQTPRKITDLRDVNPEFRELTQRMLNGETGAGTAIDPATGKRSTFLFAPVPSAGWTFVAVIEQPAGNP
jgi:serine/threonine protein kinase